MSKKLHNGAPAVHIMSERVWSLENNMLGKYDEHDRSDEDNQDLHEAHYLDAATTHRQEDHDKHDSQERFHTFHWGNSMKKQRFYPGSQDFH